MNKIDQLAKALKDSAEIKEKKKTSPYDTNAKVVRVDGNTAWVAIDGGVPQTPAIMVVNAKEGDNVRVRVGGGKAYVTGNATAPPTDDRHVLYITKEAVNYIAALKDKDVTVRTITAAAGYFDELHAKSITTDDLKATTGYIKDLTSENITAKDITADHATIDTLDSTYATIHELHSDYAEIDLANVNNAWINNGVIKDAAISDAQIVGVSANKLTAGTIDAGKINVANLRAKNLIVEKLNGQPVFGGLTTVNPNSSGYNQKNPSQEGWYEYVNAQFVLSTDTTVDDDKVYYKDDEKVALYDQTYIDGLAQDLNERIDGAVETFTGAAVPTLINYPAVDWTEAQMASHVGDIYYVINAGQSTDGYCYRFAYDNQTETYDWILIKDSDVTAALQRLVTAEGDISGLKTFETNTESWITDTDEELGSLKTRTTTLETNMGDKVDKTTFNEVKQTVDENSAVITDLTEWQAVTPDGQTTTGYKNIVNKVNQTATANKSSISSLETTVGDNSSGLVKRTSDIEQTVNGISTKVTAIEGWEIGGRNLLTGTKEAKELTTNANQNWFAPQPYKLSAFADTEIADTNRTDITISFDYSITGVDTAFNMTASLRTSTSSGGIYSAGVKVAEIPVGDSSGHAVGTRSITSDMRNNASGAGIMISGSGNANANAVVTISNVKLEFGNKATDWSPAPEDTDAEISALESSITQTADKISLVVKSGTSASNLELTDAAINAVADNMVIKSSTDNSKTVIQGGKIYADQIEIGSLAGEIGGRNLILKSDTVYVKDLSTSGTVLSAGDLSDYGKTVLGVVDTDVVLSFEAKASTAGLKIGGRYIRNASASPVTTTPAVNTITLTTGWVRYVAKFAISATGAAYLGFYTGGNTATSGTVSVRNVKVETGNKATDWTPAPEDLEKSYYGSCGTAAATAAKVVTCDGFTLNVGAIIGVRFVNGNTCTTAITLNVNGTGAKTVLLSGSNTGTAERYNLNLMAYATVTFVYDGTYWRTIGIDQTSTMITRIDNTGISIHPNGTSDHRVEITSSGMEVYKGGNSVAFYGSDIRLGEETSSRLFITSDGIDAYTPNGIQLFSLNKNGGLKNQYARLEQWQTTAQSVNLSTTLGSAWTNLSAGQIFRIRGTCYYETASDVGVAYARPFEQFTKGTASTGTAITYDGNNTLTISTSGIPSGGTYEYSDLEFLKVDIVPAPFYNFADDGPTSGGANSFVIGTGTIAGNPNQLALGAYNAERLNGLLIIGGGTSSARKNLAVVTDTGDLFLKGNLYVSSNDAGTSGTKANSGIDIASKITFGSAWTQQVKVARRIGNMVFFQLEANAGTFNANTNYVLANIASGYRPAVQQFATGITTDSSYNPKGTVSAVLKTDGSINIRMQTASSSGAYVFVSGFYYTA